MTSKNLVETSGEKKVKDSQADDLGVQQASTDASTAVRELTLALMYLSRFRPRGGKGRNEPWQAWKGYDFDVLNDLDARDLIRGSVRAKSAYLSKAGMAAARRILAKYGIADWPSMVGLDDGD